MPPFMFHFCFAVRRYTQLDNNNSIGFEYNKTANLFLNEFVILHILWFKRITKQNKNVKVILIEFVLELN